MQMKQTYIHQVHRHASGGSQWQGDMSLQPRPQQQLQLHPRAQEQLQPTIGVLFERFSLYSTDMQQTK